MGRRLVIAVDCDDVIVDTSRYVVETYNMLYKTSVQLAHAYQSNNSEWEADRDEVFRRFRAIQSTAEFGALAPRDDAIDTIHKLAAERYELHLVTARPHDIEQVTQKMVERYFPGCFSGMHHAGPDKSKGDICRDIGADILIDDNIRHLQTAHGQGVNTLVWFGDYPWQGIQRVDAEMIPITSCSSWYAVGKVIKHVS